MSPAHAAGGHDPANCENCAAPLQGAFCHACGQSVHNPLRHAGHALEEVFESFWHLDGRVFRTLRDLLFPGRAINRYLAGHRVSYVAPLRLFVVLSVLTFFAVQYTLHVSDRNSDVVKINGVPAKRIGSIGDAPTVAEVERLRHKALQDLQAAHDGKDANAATRKTIEKAIAAVNKVADERVAALKQAEADGRPVEDTSSDIGQMIGWDAQKNPIRVGWLPDPVNRWLTAQAEHGKGNLSRIQKDPGLFVHAYFSAVPKALFVLVPVFALLLKLFYLRSGRLYLEHLLVALYSHAFLCMDLLALSLLSILGSWIEPHAGWIGYLTGPLSFLLWWWMPVYLLLTQKAVYRQSWPLTLVKYFVLGGIYFTLVFCAALLLVLISVVHV